jgi:hypothetical protein
MDHIERPEFELERGVQQPYPGLAEADMTVSERRDNRVFEAIGCPQPELLRWFIEHIDRARICVGELGCLGNDGRQNRFKIDR